MREAFLAGLVILLCFPAQALACPCLRLEADGKEQANAIFTGKVIDVEDIGSQHQRATFKILSSKKGPSSGKLQVISENSKDQGCSAQFKKGHKYLVYTHEYEYLDYSSGKMIKVPHYSSECSSKKTP